MFYVLIALLIVLIVFGLFSVLRARQLKEGYENPWSPDYIVWRTEYLKRYNAICPLHKYLNTVLSAASKAVASMGLTGDGLTGEGLTGEALTGEAKAIAESILPKPGQESLEIIAKNLVKMYKNPLQILTADDTMKALLMDTVLQKNIGDGKLVVCDSNNLPPDVEPSNKNLNELLTFFAGFSADSDIILYRSALIVRDLLKMQTTAIGNALNPDVGALKKMAAGTGSTGTASAASTASAETTEGFFAGLCSENMLQERQSMNEANSCIDPSQISYDKQIKMLQNILQKYLAVQRSTADYMDIVGEAYAYMEYMKNVKEKALDGTLPMPQVL